MRITARFRWIPWWITENPKWLAVGSCAAPAKAVEMSHRSETGTTWGRPRERGRSRETGPSRGYLAPAGGARHRHSQATASRCGEAGQGPCISYMQGPCLILPARNAAPAPAPHVGGRRNAPARHPVVRAGQPRFWTGCAATERPASAKVVGVDAAVHTHVDHLCKTAPGLCTRGGNAGDFAARPRS